MVNNSKKDSLKDGNQSRSKQLLLSRMAMVKEKLVIFLDQNGINLPVLEMAMEEFATSVMDLPEGTACQAGCHYCCHLRLGVSIPEVVVIYSQLLSQATPEGLSVIRQRILDTAAKGNTLLESFWFESKTPCPFLNEKGRCLIYALRPFPCRAHHSTDIKICRDSFEKGTSLQIPCFTLYWASTDMYSSIFIKVLADKGFASFQVGFIKALEILFTDDNVIESWLKKEDVFVMAKLPAS